MILLVKVYMSQSPPRLSEAIELQKQVVNILIENFGEDHTLTLMEMECLAEFYKKQNRLREAGDLLRQILKSRRGQDKKPTIEVLDTMKKLSEIRYAQKRYEEALGLEVECLDAYIEEYGPNSVAVAHMKISLAATLYELGNTAQAKNFVKEAIIVYAEDLEDHGEEFKPALKTLDLFENPVKAHAKMAYREFKEPIMTELGILKYKWHCSQSGDYRRGPVEARSANVNQVEMALIKGVSTVFAHLRR
ncbi:hypothetical protein FRC19_010246 [Serendipita sp. 401]|nr:hypothetical protein FRC19_010246 [Serendipita sp. 401]KAG8834103.1 hypothetical protein FRC18_002618 [Serendipita sp. 400]KAG9052692.1 hypothetical protein FS842_009398 [Serendipita sp. 407]